jgi:hypothetical protein
MISARVIADSLAPSGVRITTMVLTYPRYIHSEFMTHRVFSRNASSSRAIPVRKQIRAVMKDMVVPIHIGANQKGMQAETEVSPLRRKLAVVAWKACGYFACFTALVLDKLGVHKQVANRVIEPWSHITVVVTSTKWKNFFNLRTHKTAQPEIQRLASYMKIAYNLSEPKKCAPGQWHLPFVHDVNDTVYEKQIDHWIKVSVARCARVSYLNHDGKKPTTGEDIALYERLVGSHPIHASPAEHQAQALGKGKSKVQSGNFHGWIQYRKTLSGESGE